MNESNDRTILVYDITDVFRPNMGLSHGISELDHAMSEKFLFRRRKVRVTPVHILGEIGGKGFEGGKFCQYNVSNNINIGPK